jgi:succinate dehydrogenase hydrophobic anchor subunit
MTKRSYLQRKEGAFHWYGQRFTAIALLPITGLLFITLLQMALSSKQFTSLKLDMLYTIYEQMTHQIPNNLFISIAGIILQLHIMQGLHSIVLDYIPNTIAQKITLSLINLICYSIMAITAITHMLPILQ